MNNEHAMSLNREADLVACAIQNWYPIFSKHTFKTRLIPFSEEVASWLVEDGVVLPNVDDVFPRRSVDELEESEEWSTDSSEQEDEQEEGNNDVERVSMPSSELNAIYDKARSAIDDLGGKVFPKLQWSCPKDAAWMLPNNSISCCTPDEIFLVLKSSDRAAHDVAMLQNILKQSSPRSPLRREDIYGEQDGSSADDEAGIVRNRSHVLALRKWYNLKPGREFRCFVINKRLVGISQRDLSQRFQYIVENGDILKDSICEFYWNVVRDKFHLPSYVFDCYVPESENASIKVVDFNPIEDTTNPLLFSWEDVYDLRTQSNCPTSQQVSESSISGDDTVEFRFIDNDMPIKPESALYGVPYDFVDTSHGSALSSLLDQAQRGTMPWDELCRNGGQ